MAASRGHATCKARWRTGKAGSAAAAWSQKLCGESGAQRHGPLTMLLIACPWCGPRAQTEFAYGGEAHIARPLETDALTDEQWGDYLFMRKNPRGRHREQWVHTYGCRRWFNVERDTVSYRITAVYKPGEPPPDSQPEGAT